MTHARAIEFVIIPFCLSSASVRRRVPQGEGASFRQEGGVYRFNNKDDEDDENNTWNGNSTQQM